MELELTKSEKKEFETKGFNFNPPTWDQCLLCGKYINFTIQYSHAIKHQQKGEFNLISEK